MDFVEVVSAAIQQFKTDACERSFFISLMGKPIINEVEAITEDLLGQSNYILKDSEDKKGHRDKLKKSLEGLLDDVYKMEDCAETFFLRSMHASRMGFGRRYNFILQKLYLKAEGLDFAGEMRKIKFNISKTKDEISESLKNIQESHEESDVIGFEGQKNELVRWLTDDASFPNLGLILISGKIGSGKTTLAREICMSSEIESHFQFHRWVSASEDPNANVFRSIWEQITEDSTVDMRTTEKKLVAEIRENLQKNRCLVVFDGALSGRVVNIPAGLDLPDDGNGSRLIMTTSGYVSKGYGDADARVLTCKLKPLNAENAWKLFEKVSLTDNVQFDIETLKSKIINICEGIPSAIVALGRFLSTKKNSEEWLAVLDQHPIEPNEVLVSEILAMMNSRDLTTFGLRCCLLYFMLFPKGYKIPVRRLLRLWLAEGFVTDSREQTESIPGDLEKTAEKYLYELVQQEMINITELRKDGSPKTCRIPGILYDICLSKAEDIFGLLHIYQTTPDASRKFGVRRVAEHGDINNYSCKDSHMQDLRSYLSFNTRKKDTAAVEIGNFLSTEVISHRGFGLLKVLDLERVYKPTLPHNLGKLYQLRYLGLRWTFLDALPPSVSKLRFLETLDVKHTNISSPPNSIWKMYNLRHLCLNGIRLDMPAKKQSISLPGLHTLWGLLVDIKSQVKYGLDGLIHLRKLGLTFRLDSVEELNEWIASLEGLESLRLRSKDENGRPSELKLKPLSRLKNLTNVYLIGNLPELHSEYFPHSIKVLTLSISKLKEDPMPILAKLPMLRVLRLLGDSYTGKEMVWPREGFPVLTTLKLWMLKELETWTVEEGVKSALIELEIRCCHKLKKLPSPQILSWKIVLTNMPKEFEDYVRADKYCYQLITDTLQF